jgi:hypothetical protein
VGATGRSAVARQRDCPALRELFPARRIGASNKRADLPQMREGTKSPELVRFTELQPLAGQREGNPRL